MYMRRLLLAVMVLSALLSTACGGDEKPKEAARPDPRTVVQRAAEKMEQVSSFHFVLDHEKGYTPIVLGLRMSRTEGDVVRPDRMRADVEAGAAGIPLRLKFVNVAASAKITNPFNPSQWQDLPSDFRLRDVFDPGAGAIAALRSVKDPQITGEETINGVKVWRVEGNLDAEALAAVASLAEPGYVVKGIAWVGQETNEVYRIRLEGPLGSQDAPDVIRRLELSRHGERIEITPVPG